MVGDDESKGRARDGNERRDDDGKMSWCEVKPAPQEVQDYLAAQIWKVEDSDALLVLATAREHADFLEMMGKAGFHDFCKGDDDGRSQYMALPIAWLQKAAPKWFASTDEMHGRRAMMELQKISANAAEHNASWKYVDESCTQAQFICETKQQHDRISLLLKKAHIPAIQEDNKNGWRTISIHAKYLQGYGIEITERSPLKDILRKAGISRDDNSTSSNQEGKTR